VTLQEELLSVGLSPPKAVTPGRWLRFPGIGKDRSNRAGWCRMITETLAIYGDWSSDFHAVWRDDTHRDDATSQRLLNEAHERERQFAAGQRRLQLEGARRAQELLEAATPCTHPYLARKGFPSMTGLVFGEYLLIPVRDVNGQRLISLQQVSPEGEKRFLHGARARGGIFRLGGRPGKTLLCEGYATGLSLVEAARRLFRSAVVIVCFSAGNVEVIAQYFPQGLICADHDPSGTGERIARKTRLPWVMPPEVGDFNDLHTQRGLHAVVEILRGH